MLRRPWIQVTTVIGACALFGALTCRAAETNLIANGSFEQSGERAGLPDDWACAGNRAIRQQLSLDSGRDGKRCAKLECTEFTGDGPDFHVMICQVGKVGVRRGQWYRLTLWAKAEGVKSGAIEVALTDTRRWENAGLEEVFTPAKGWQEFQFLFRAREDLPAEASRLQIWFKGTGTLWLDDLVLTETSEGQQWFPQVATEGVKNFVPNSSFECGAANWGSFTYGLSGWAGNLYRLEGDVDSAVAQHGRHSLKICLTPKTLPVFYFDYYDPVRQPVCRVLAANQGWFRVRPGEALTLSAYLRADAEGVAAQLAANEAPSHLLRKQVTVGKEWQRHEFSFVPSQPFLFIAVGLDLEASKREAATLWVDAVQLERGNHATAYEPRQPVESFIESAVTGNIFTNPAAGCSVAIRAFNNSDHTQTVRGQFRVTDFSDRTVLSKDHALRLPAGQGSELPLKPCCRGREGFFRATWASGTSTQALRCALITPAPAGLADSPLGFNHAYPWNFLVRLSRQAGVVWWRDWSAKWQTVEPKQGSFDFSAADPQIQRVLDLDSEVEVLLPFPSASWSTTARAAEVETAAGNNSYLRSRLPLSYAPADLNDFGTYAAAVARHYRQSRPRAPTHFQILNEPVYTDYALPRKFGYSLADYLRIVEVGSRALHAADPQCRVVGGISANLTAGLTRQFVEQGGLQWVDVFDLHMYDPARPAETFEEPFSALEELMRAHGGPKPVWITEWGCYADDDPACLPESVGDATMNRCRWPSERAAAEHIVKFTAVSFAHGLRKIFFHAGTCGTINGPDAGGVLFEYGGAPRKMYPAVAALTRLLGVPEACVKSLHSDGEHAYVFRTGDKEVAITWCEAGHSRPLRLNRAVQACDIMGNSLPASEAVLGESPLYLVSKAPDAILAALAK
jgi:Carbohydrate binding domain